MNGKAAIDVKFFFLLSLLLTYLLRLPKNQVRTEFCLSGSRYIRALTGWIDSGGEGACTDSAHAVPIPLLGRSLNFPWLTNNTEVHMVRPQSHWFQQQNCCWLALREERCWFYLTNHSSWVPSGALARHLPGVSFEWAFCSSSLVILRP